MNCTSAQSLHTRVVSDSKDSSLSRNRIEPTPVVFIGVLELWADRGASIHMREIAQALQENEIDPWVVCLRGENRPRQDAAIHEIAVGLIPLRFLRQISWNIVGTIAAIRAVLNVKAKVIYTRLDCGMFAGLFAARLTGRKLIVEMNGLPTRDLELYRPSSRILIAFSRWWESLQYQSADLIVGAPGYARYVQKHFNVPESKLCIVPLGVNTKLFSPLDRMLALRKTGFPDCASTAVWVGTLAGWQGLDTLIDAAALLHNWGCSLSIVVVGDGVSKASLMQKTERLGLQDYIVFTDNVPYQLVPHYIAAAKVCLATFPGDRGEKHSISALKTLNYLSCGRPVITTEMDEVAPAIIEHDAGRVISPDDPLALANAISDLISEPDADWHARCGRTHKALGPDRSWTAIAEDISERIRSLS